MPITIKFELAPEQRDIVSSLTKLNFVLFHKGLVLCHKHFEFCKVLLVLKYGNFFDVYH